MLERNRGGNKKKKEERYKSFLLPFFVVRFNAFSMKRNIEK